MYVIPWSRMEALTQLDFRQPLAGGGGSYAIHVERCDEWGNTKQRANGEFLHFNDLTHWHCVRSDAAGMTRDGRWRCTRIMHEVKTNQETKKADAIRADVFLHLDDLLTVLPKALDFPSVEGGEDIPMDIPTPLTAEQERAKTVAFLRSRRWDENRKKPQDATTLADQIERGEHHESS